MQMAACMVVCGGSVYVCFCGSGVCACVCGGGCGGGGGVVCADN